MVKKYTTVMLPHHIAVRLRAYAASMRRSAERRQLPEELTTDNNQPSHQGVTLWRAVERLLELDQRHKERDLLAKAKRRARRAK